MDEIVLADPLDEHSTIKLPDGTTRDFTLEARGIIRGTYAGRVTRYHVLALAYEIEDLHQKIRQLSGLADAPQGGGLLPSPIAPAALEMDS